MNQSIVLYVTMVIHHCTLVWLWVVLNKQQHLRNGLEVSQVLYQQTSTVTANQPVIRLNAVNTRSQATRSRTQLVSFLKK